MCDASHKLQMALDSVVIACDQLGEAIAAEHGAGKNVHDSGVLDPFLTLWRLRWELGLGGGDIEGAEPVQRAAIAECEHRSGDDDDSDDGDEQPAECAE